MLHQVRKYNIGCTLYYFYCVIKLLIINEIYF